MLPTSSRLSTSDQPHPEMEAEDWLVGLHGSCPLELGPLLQGGKSLRIHCFVSINLGSHFQLETSNGASQLHQE